MTSSERSAKNVNIGEIGKKDLQLLLQEKLGDQVIVLKSESESLLPPGENFACMIFKVHAVIKRDEKAPEEDLHLVAKMFPYAQSMKEMFDFAQFFKKEIFFYKKLMPVFKQLEIDFGVAEQITHIGPKIFGTRRSLDPNAENIDDGVIILMENLKMKGYYTLDKIEGLDLYHSKLTIKALARFHALGIACKHHRPEFFKNEVLAHAKVVPFKDNDEQPDIFESMYEMMLKDSRFTQYQERIRKQMTPEQKLMFYTYVAEEPWLTIIHFDFWTNNILYHKDNEGNVDDIKIIDFQNYTYNSPLRDVTYFLGCSTSYEVMTKHFNELLDLYYDTFIEDLKKMRCDVELFSRKAFDEQLKLDASLEFCHNILAIKFFCAEIDKKTYDSSQLEDVVILSNINALGYDKWYQIVLTYVKQGWL